MTSWTFNDLEKIKRNRFRPISELKSILKNKYSEEEIRTAKADILEDLEKSSKTRPRKSTIPEETIKILYENSALSADKLFKKYPELCKKYSVNTMKTYFSWIKAELKGIHTPLADSIYSLVELWYNSSHLDKIPERGSLGIRKGVKKRAIQNVCSKPLRTSLREKDSDVIERLTKDFSKDSQLKVGILIDGKIDILLDSVEQAVGAEKLYQSLGKSDCKKVRILMEEI